MEKFLNCMKIFWMMTDKEIIEEIENSKVKLKIYLKQYKFRDALFEVIDLARKGNKYMQEKEPWMKADKSSCDSSSQPRKSES